MSENVLDFLETSARRLPDKPAFVSERRTLTFAQLLERSRRVGSAVCARARAGRPVAVVMSDRDAHTVAALLGVLYAGCCYAPLDANMPSERLRDILERLSPEVVLVDAQTRAAAEAAGAWPLLDFAEAARAALNTQALLERRKAARAEDALSILFTSGSTGAPKGVVQTQGAYLAYARATIEKYGFTGEDVFGNQSPFFYANSIIDIYPPLALGATVHILPARALAFPAIMVERLAALGVTELTMTPSSYVRVAEAGALREGCLPNLKYIILSGEAARWETLEAWLRAAPNAGAWNFYGSTEAFSVAVWRLDRRFDVGEVIPVGPPFAQARLLFFDEQGRSVPPGAGGSMLVSSPWVASGYFGDAERTQESFVYDPLGVGEGRRYYRTGDEGRINEEGQLVILGRKDNQFKRGGYRMELGEVEAALRAVPGWRDGCALFDAASGRLCVFWTGALSQAELKRELRKRLPRYAVPDTYIHVDGLPHTATMKLDRRALRALLP